MQVAGTIPKSRKAIQIFIFLLVLATTFLWIQIDKSAQSRREWAAAQNEDNDGLEFSTSGLLDRTIVVTMFPPDQTEEDSLVGFVVHDAAWKELRDGLRARGFNRISCGPITEEIQ